MYVQPKYIQIHHKSRSNTYILLCTKTSTKKIFLAVQLFSLCEPDVYMEYRLYIIVYYMIRVNKQKADEKKKIFLKMNVISYQQKLTGTIITRRIYEFFIFII